MKLTRYLYHIEDVKYSFLTSLLKGDDIKEVLFWTSELYYSGYYNILYNLIWKVYYDFYAVTNPLIEKKINRLNNNLIEKFNKLNIKSELSESKNQNNIKLTITTSEDESVKNIIYILHLLFNAELIDYRVFEFRFLIPKNENLELKIKQKNIKWLQRLKKKLKEDNFKLLKIEELFLISIHNNNSDSNIKFYLLKIDVNRCYYILKKYYSIIKNIKLKDKNDYLQEILYEDKYHILMAIICYFDMDENDEVANKRIVLKKYNSSLYNYFCNTNNTNNIEPHKILKEKRDYFVNKNIGCFKINLNINKSEILYYYWEYYSSLTLLWKERYEKYNCTFKNKKPIFKNDDYLESFYEKYGYEPDEQSKAVQLKSTCEINNNNIYDWLKYIFEEEINIDKNIKKVYDY